MLSFQARWRCGSATTHSVERHEGTCSLLYIYNQEHMNGEGGERTPAGRATAVGVCGVLPFFVGFWLGGLGRRRQ